MAAIYKGTLRGKRKNDLMEMANALGLRIDEESTRRDDVEAQLKTYLLTHRGKLQTNPQWAGIYHSMDQSDKRAAHGNATALSPDSDASDDGSAVRKHTQKSRPSTLANGVTASTPLRRASNVAAVADEGAHNIASAVSAKARRSFEDLSAAFRSGTAEVRADVSEATADVSQASAQAKRTARRSVSNVEKRFDAAFIRARNYLSDAHNITMLLLIVEATLLVSHIMPTATFHLGDNPLRAVAKNVVAGKGLTTDTRMTLSVPNLWVLLSTAFWRPIFLWTAWTVALPLLAAHLITFDRKHEPSALTFSLVRLAILSIVSKRVLFTSKDSFSHVVGVAAGEARQTSAAYFGSLFDLLDAIVSYDFVAPFLSIDLQMLYTSLAAAFAAYEVVAHRPRGA